MFNAIGRKLTGNPCIGCPVRNIAYFPEREYGEGYIETPEFNPNRYKASLVTETCEKALGKMGVSASVRFASCQERFADPDAAYKAIRIRLQNVLNDIEDNC